MIGLEPTIAEAIRAGVARHGERLPAKRFEMLERMWEEQSGRRLLRLPEIVNPAAD